jgi:hypothetical protein
MCGGGPSSTSTSSSTSKSIVPKYIEKAGKANLSAANDYYNRFKNDTPLTRQAFGSIVENSNWANDYMMPYQQQLIQSLYEGGGLGEGADYIRDAYGQASNAYQPYLQEGYLDPMTNPYLQPAIEAARSSSFNDVADRFHKAGRSFSGAESGAYGTAATNAALPMLLGQYNQNVGAQQGAAQGLLSGATGASSGLTQAQQAVLQAKMAAPGQIGNLNIPENMLLGIADRRQQSAQDALNMRIAALSGTPYSTTTTNSGTGSSQQFSDPFQTMLGGGLGLLGMFM